MPWLKKGRIFSPENAPDWGKFASHTLAPWLRDQRTARVFAGFRDAEGISRIGYVDVDLGDSFRVTKVSARPCLDVGRAGMFDDNGLIPGDVVNHDGKLYLFYDAFQMVAKAKFVFLTGLATSTDGGESFDRVSEAPILPRSDEGLFVRTVTSVMVENGRWRVWYAAGSRWTMIDGKPYPYYSIRHQTSTDPSTWGKEGRLCLEPEGKEYRVGRPRVYRRDGGYEMYYTFGTTDGVRAVAKATSSDGLTWKRSHEDLGLGPTGNAEWDGEEVCYPALVNHGGRTFMFYNGNGMGRTGFGLAEWA